MKKEIFYNGGNLLSKNRLINFIIGNRGGGKSFYWKTKCLKNFLEKGEQFIWIRRYNSELENISTWGSDIAFQFEGHKIEANKKNIKIDGKICGYVGALSTSQRLKSTSYPNVTLMVFDEFLIDKGSLRYIKGEAEIYLELIETVFRMRDNNIRCVCVGNAISIVNPYFTYFQVKPNLNNQFTLYQDICIELYSNEDYIKEKKKTRFGRLIDNTKYGEYAIENKFLRDNYSFIKPRPSKNLDYENTIFYEGEYYGVWYNNNFPYDYLYIDKVVEPNCSRLLTVKLDELNENGQYIKNQEVKPYILQLKLFFNEGKIYYDDIDTKMKMYEVIKII